MKGPVLAVDHGAKRTGFAASDPLRIATRPLETWHGAGDSPELVEHVAGLVREHRATHVVVGSPLRMGGEESDRSRVVRTFVEALRERLPDVSFVLQDERLSTKAAEDLLRDAGHFGAERKARRDSWSALVILRDWIEAGEPE